MLKPLLRDVAYYKDLYTQDLITRDMLYSYVDMGFITLEEYVEITRDEQEPEQ